MFEEWSKPHQMFGLILVTLIMTTLMCAITSLFSTDILLVTSLITTLIILLYFIWCWQSCLRLSRSCGMIFAICLLLVIGFFLIYWPYREFWKQPVQNWTSHPTEIVDYLFSIILSFTFIFVLLNDIYKNLHELRPHQYIYATFKIYIECVLIMMAAFRSVSVRMTSSSTTQVARVVNNTNVLSKMVR